MTGTAPNIYQRINRAGQILQANPWIKDMGNSQYKSVDIDQIRRHVGAAEVEAGIVVGYSEDEFGIFPMGGKTYARVSATLTYVNIDDPSDAVSFNRTAIAFDSGDKGFNKCESMLYKNHYKGLYHIGERSEDPDAYSNEEQDLLTVFKLCNDGTRAQILKIARANAADMEAQRKAENRRRLADKADGFFGKPAAPKKLDAPNEFHTLDDITQRLNLWVRDPRFAEITKRYGADFGVTADWSEDIVRAMFDECTILARDLGVSE